MKKYSKPEIKVKVVMIQHLMEMSAVEILQDLQDPASSDAKMQDMLWDLFAEYYPIYKIRWGGSIDPPHFC